MFFIFYFINMITAEFHGTATFGEDHTTPRKCPMEASRMNWASISPTAFNNTTTTASTAATIAAGTTTTSACGKCIKVESGAKHVMLHIVDQCQSCGPNDITMNRSSFAQLGETRMGKIPIKWNYVPCMEGMTTKAKAQKAKC